MNLLNIFNRTKKEDDSIKNPPIFKVVYFDENSAGDYLNISTKGTMDSLSETSILNQVSNESKSTFKFDFPTAATALVSAYGAFTANDQGAREIFAIISLLALGANIFALGLNAYTNRMKEDKSLIKTQIKSTVLTAFIEATHEEKTPIKEFEGYEVTMKEDSFAYLKLYLPALKLLNFEVQGFSLNKIDEVVKDIKGYYELVATKDNETKIFRVNVEALRNNYKLMDLTQMDLKYYGVKVGKVSNLDKLSFKDAFSVKTPAQVDAKQIYSLASGKESTTINNKVVEIYDIILAGVENNDRS